MKKTFILLILLSVSTILFSSEITLPNPMLFEEALPSKYLNLEPNEKISESYHYIPNIFSLEFREIYKKKDQYYPQTSKNESFHKENELACSKSQRKISMNFLTEYTFSQQFSFSDVLYAYDYLYLLQDNMEIFLYIHKSDYRGFVPISETKLNLGWSFDKPRLVYIPEYNKVMSFSNNISYCFDFRDRTLAYKINKNYLKRDNFSYVTYSKGLVFVAAEKEGLDIYKYSEKGLEFQANLLLEFGNSSNITDITIIDNKAFVLNSEKGIHLWEIDYNNIKNNKLIFTIEILGGFSLEYYKNTLLIAGYSKSASKTPFWVKEFFIDYNKNDFFFNKKIDVGFPIMDIYASDELFFIIGENIHSINYYSVYDKFLRKDLNFETFFSEFDMKEAILLTSSPQIYYKKEVLFILTSQRMKMVELDRGEASIYCVVEAEAQLQKKYFQVNILAENCSKKNEYFKEKKAGVLQEKFFSCCKFQEIVEVEVVRKRKRKDSSLTLGLAVGLSVFFCVLLVGCAVWMRRVKKKMSLLEMEILEFKQKKYLPFEEIKISNTEEKFDLNSEEIKIKSENLG